ncbi:hypothetical protein IWQ56_001802 [Coemansia nantahalensis]|nr:hypothetical protein IWQ56_001802 [Coemansia nantahalensis]
MGLGKIVLVCLGLSPPGSSGSGYSHGHCRGTAVAVVVAAAGAVAGAVMSSMVLAGVRRATGLTLRRQEAWPAVDAATAARWLRWYDERLAQASATADERVQRAVAQARGGMESPAARRLWERQLRRDAGHDLARLRDRRRYCADLLGHAQGDRAPAPRHSVALAIYLRTGECLVDRLVAWMRASPLFCFEMGADGLLDLPPPPPSSLAVPDGPPCQPAQAQAPTDPNLAFQAEPPPYTPIDDHPTATETPLG